MNHIELKKEAIKNIQTSSIVDMFSVANSDFEKLNGWTYIGMFLFEAKKSLEICSQSKTFKILNELEEVILSNAMFKNFILSYSKCFSSSGKYKISLDANDIYSNREDLKEVHKNILKARNKYVAHNDDENGFDIAIAYAGEDEETITLAQTYTTTLINSRSTAKAQTTTSIMFLLS